MTRSNTRLAVLAILVLALIGAGAFYWVLFVREAPPAPVGAATAAPAVSQPAASSSSSAAGSAAPAGTLSGSPDGTWAVDTSIGSFSDFSDSFVGYRVNETLAGNKANTAVGRTPAVSGSLTLAGSTISSVEITADLTQLQSDDQRRDGQLRNQAIETARFPNATFKLTQPIDLGAAPADGATWDVTAVGDLTLHGVAKSISLPLHAVLSGNVVTVTGSIDIAFADYSITPPSSFVVLSVEDHGILELQLHFKHG